jgi:hypothetical protein
MHLRVLGALYRSDEGRIDNRRETSGSERLRFFLAGPLTIAMRAIGFLDPNGSSRKSVAP